MVASKHQWLFSAFVHDSGELEASAPTWPRRRGAWIALVAAFAIAPLLATDIGYSGLVLLAAGVYVGVGIADVTLRSESPSRT